MRHSVIRHKAEVWVDPDVVFSTLYGQSDRAFWLDSGVAAGAGFSYLGEGVRLVTAAARTGSLSFDPSVTVESERAAEVAGDIFEFLAGEQSGAVEPAEGAGGGFRLGWIGWFGYELRAKTMALPDADQVRRSRYPDAAWLEVVRAIEFDHASGTMTLVALALTDTSTSDAWTGDNALWRDGVLAALDAGSLQTEPGRAGENVAEATESIPEIHWAHSDDEYLSMIRECQDAITNGDAYQLCLTTQVAVDIRPDPLASYLALRSLSPSHHGGFLRVGEYSLLSSSPETFLTVTTDGLIRSRPIKGTRRRGNTAQEDAALRTELAASEKERAENLMIVDLMRNDIARVSEVGSVSVPDLLAVESYAQVHQLVSTVQGQLRSDLRPMDAVVACFPAGSMTGAPKSSAAAILDALEGRPRGVYSGAFGYLGLDGRIELAMVIRSIVLDSEGATIGTGGGITALSVPEEELEEVKLKAAALLSVLGAGGS
ncbi:MAG: aminodeoxychorismate synthase component I [Lacisediminihabitans sp.]